MNMSDQVVVCRCKDVTREQIMRAIADGCETLDEIKRCTCAGMGSCQGRTCRHLIADELAAILGEKIEAVSLPTFRAPVKPVSMGALADAYQEQDKGE
jgi:bacterioferritin-associated ferredoxin